MKRLYQRCLLLVSILYGTTGLAEDYSGECHLIDNDKQRLHC
jgi:hypothetical protein